MKEFWDERYKGHATVYGEAPNLFFQQFIDTHTPGSILLPADGEGRNGLYAAFKGWEVRSFDFSTVAREKALKQAAEKNISLQYDILSIEDYQPGVLYDAIGLIYVHLPAGLRQEFHQKMIESMKPGAHLVLEAYSKDQLKYNSGGPKEPALLYDLQTLKSDFAALDCILCEETEEFLDEGPFHKGKAAIVRYVAKKR
ncbi:MAG: SAM-dependent methyltransferase [Chitinophagaceae bacterium]|nr:SAM-dependent methyltransferase [Chitinophagaceae bacterium]MBL0336940.1 SAM-dependent methyltransferase [Chitinophagaceae bacterium]